MAFQTYIFELLQTKGEKGKALRNAMHLWTVTVAKFLEYAADNCQALEKVILSERGRLDKKALAQWVYDNLKIVPERDLLEPTMKHAVYRTLDSQLRSYFALKIGDYDPGFPTGRTVTEADFAALLDEFTTQSHINTPENDYVTLSGLVSGCGKKSQYLPLDFYYYKPEKGFFICKSSDGAYFAGIFLEPGSTGFTPLSDDLVIVGTGEKVVARKKPCRLFPIAMNKWLQRKLESYKPANGRVVERNGRFFLHVALEIPDRELMQPLTIMGVDLGKKRIAAASITSMDGDLWLKSISVEGLHVQQAREITQKVAKAQAKGVKYRFRYRHLNEQIVHITVNNIIKLAKEYKSIVVIEELSNLRAANSSAGKSNTNQGRKSNTYGTFHKTLLYKCLAAGIPVDEVGAAYTSQTCPKCGSVDKNNRLVQEEDGRITRFKFKCRQCGFSHDNSDEVAAVNIARKYIYKKECIATKKKSKSATNKSWQDFVQQMCAG
ncbi:MAG: transposase [Armatimonadetes bacterium]|nr:transposase [Armatimonadota bacterium]